MTRLHFLTMLSCLALAGCGGGTLRDLGPSGEKAPSTTGLTTLESSAPNAVSNLAAIALNSSTTTVTRGNGTLRHGTGGIDLTLNGVVLLNDVRRVNGIWTNGSVTLTPNTTLTPAPFQFVKFYDLAGSSGSGPIVLGVVAAGGALPTSGTAVYNGPGFVDGAYLGGTTTFASSGVSTVTANFNGAGSVDVTIDSFNSGNAPFTRMTISGMTLNRTSNSYTGGTISLHDGASDITATTLGANQTTTANGQFFGNETGGIFVGTGTDGTLSGGFLAR